ncbi:inter-alpha-trypsin inhibitor heavy chain H6 isoform X2 [Alligator mississippiensis]|uniref:inter-alpha-trypsin inhibitor heavy chain H6 isoform X2 n=1 Tax=Alligator mississippiensis TaxID=8496 RepID=UPI0009071E1B|nr:inter-alpha-trypsin inhibitor heavy chain H6 isoform X2 [Alligator mississippiensis]
MEPVSSTCCCLLLLGLAALIPPGCPLPWEALKRPIRAIHAQLPVSSFHINSTIMSRYAITRVRAVLNNPHAEAQAAAFDLDLPSTAFISNFSITVNGRVHVAEVKEKQEAKQLYEAARRRGQTAAHVGTRYRDMEKFQVWASVLPSGTVTFELSYEELLQRQQGQYQQALSIRPGAVVTDLAVNIQVAEPAGLAYLRVLPLRTSRLLTNAISGDADLPPSTRVEKGPHCAQVVFTPTREEQVTFSSTGIAADFVLQYDVAMPDVAGDLQLYDGYFVHFFAPRGLPPIRKHVVFVIDISGSMAGTKMEQTKQAMQVILGDLHLEDLFNIVAFSEVAHVWQPSGSVPPSAAHLHAAIDYVNQLEAKGWTDIHQALLTAASLFPLPSSSSLAPQHFPLLLFLTDGEATAGVTSAPRILAAARQALGGATVALFGLAFGADADFGLLHHLALDNRGLAQRVHEDTDATLQLAGFYNTVAAPLLADVALSYLPAGVSQPASHALFPHYFQGAELVVAGRVPPEASELQVGATGIGRLGPVALETQAAGGNLTQPLGCSAGPSNVGSFVRRLWAYFTVQKLLEARVRADDAGARRLLAQKATSLALDYGFVTPVTSLVVVMPEEDKEGEAPAPTLVTRKAHNPSLVATVARDLSVATVTPNPSSVSSNPSLVASLALAPSSMAPVLGGISVPTDSGQVPTEEPDPIVPRPGTPTAPSPLGMNETQMSRKKSGPFSWPTAQPWAEARGSGDTIIRLLPPDTELAVPEDTDGRFEESLDPPPIYSVMVANREAGAPDDEDVAAQARFFTFSSSGLTVRGQLVGAPPWPGAPERTRTFLGAVTVALGRMQVHATPAGLVLKGPGEAQWLPWGAPGPAPNPGLKPGLGLQVRGATAVLRLAPRLALVVRYHHYPQPRLLQRDHLGFYVSDGRGLSPRAHGLLGQLRKGDIWLRQGPGPGAWLCRGGAAVPARLVTKLLPGLAPRPRPAPCWLVRPRDAAALLGGAYDDFLATPRLPEGAGLPLKVETSYGAKI